MLIKSFLQQESSDPCHILHPLTALVSSIPESPQEAGNKQSQSGAWAPRLPGGAICVHLGLDGEPRSRDTSAAQELIPNLAQEAPGSLRLQPARPSKSRTHLFGQKTTLQGLWGKSCPLEKLVKASEDREGLPRQPQQNPALRSTKPYLQTRGLVAGPCDCGQQPPQGQDCMHPPELLSRAPHCCPAASARSSTLSPTYQASLDPGPDRPGFSDFILPGGHESGQLGSLDPK